MTMEFQFAFALTLLTMSAAITALIRTRAALARANRTAEIASRRLTNLRRNCFLTDERGHRRRYAACSVEVRAMAEAD